MNKDYLLVSNDTLTLITRNKGIHSWRKLISFVRQLPYGRNANRSDLSLVLKEEKGSCSSKHALLKKIADLNQIPGVQLILGIYRMNEENTPKIGNILSENNLDFIPEAHCYLKIDGQRFDWTSAQSDFGKISDDILIEKEIEAEQVSEFKVNFHQEFLKNWLAKNNSAITFEKLWNIREKCIEKLGA